MKNRLIALIAAIAAVIMLSGTGALAAGTGETVILTNCDTGRALYCNDICEFIYTDEGDGKFTLALPDGGYVDLSSGTAASSAEKCILTATEFPYGRVQISVPNGRVVADRGGEESSQAQIVMYNATPARLESGWYITPPDKTPLKVMALGDSLTYGSNPDSNAPTTSYRMDLSGMLTDYFGNVCFVGNEKTTAPWGLQDKYLPRHCGYGGHVIAGEGLLEGQPGIEPLTAPALAKFTPDIVILMIGTNDCAFLPGDEIESGLAELSERWENYVREIEAALPEDGLLICASVPPLSFVSYNINTYNANVKSGVEKLNAEGLKITFADVNGAFDGTGIGYFSSDMVHLNEIGYSALADLFYGVISGIYSSDTTRAAAIPAQYIPPVIEEPESSSDAASSSDASESEPEKTPAQEQPAEVAPKKLTAGKVVLLIVLPVVLVLSVVTVLIIRNRRSKTSK